MRLVGPHKGDVYAAPFLFNRMVTTVPSCVRLLWRLHTRSPGELLLVQGAVEYDDVKVARYRNTKRAVRDKTKRRIDRGSEHHCHRAPVGSHHVLGW